MALRGLSGLPGLSGLTGGMFGGGVNRLRAAPGVFNVTGFRTQPDKLRAAPGEFHVGPRGITATPGEFLIGGSEA